MWYFFSDFQYGFKSSRSNCIFLFADCGFWFSTCLVPLELEDLICQIFSRGWHCGLANKRKCFGSYIRISGFISSFLSINRLRVISVVKFSEGYSFDVGVLRAPFLAVLFYINDLPVVCNIPIYVWWYYSFLPNMIGLPICINSSNWLLNLILAYKIPYTVVGSGLLISVLRKPFLLRVRITLVWSPVDIFQFYYDWCRWETSF